MSGTFARLGLLASLYFRQGLPFGFFTQSLPVFLRAEGASLETIGLSSLLTLPWALKFLWAPLVDRFSLPGLGRRKSWILPLQLTAVVVLAGLAFFDAESSMSRLMAAVFVLNLIAATQDIATDGWAVEMLRPEERGWANGLQVAAYRVGMIAGGGVLLIFLDLLKLDGALLAMAAMTAVASVPVALAREPAARPGRAHPSVWSAWSGLFRRPAAVRLMGLLLVYKAGEYFASTMLRPLLVDLGSSVGELGYLLGTAGFTAGLLGALVGGALVAPLGRTRALVWFGALQALSVAGYLWLSTSLGGPQPSWTFIYGVCAFEHLASGMATAALFTCMMDVCAPEHAGSEYTLQASLVVISSGVAATLSGFGASALGYPGHFALATALCVGAALAAVSLGPKSNPAG